MPHDTAHIMKHHVVPDSGLAHTVSQQLHNLCKDQHTTQPPPGITHVEPPRNAPTMHALQPQLLRQLVMSPLLLQLVLLRCCGCSCSLEQLCGHTRPPPSHCWSALPSHITRLLRA